MWELYERLIEPIPDDVPVDEIIVGTSCTMVRAGGAAGAAANQRLESRPRILEEEEWERGMTWRQAASLISSWNFLEAGIGAAAINAYYNREAVLMDGIAAYEGVKILESCAGRRVCGKKSGDYRPFPLCGALSGKGRRTLCSGEGTAGGRLSGYGLRIHFAGNGLHLHNRVHSGE